MNTPNNKQNNHWTTAIKVFLASLSITSLFGLWNLFNKSNQEASAEVDDTASGNTSALNTALPTLVPSALDSPSTSQSIQELAQVTAQETQPTAAPVIERVVIGTSGSSGGGAPAARTSSS